MMYGRTGYNKLSTFIRDEIPSSLIHNESPRREPPKRPQSYFDPFMQSRTAQRREGASFGGAGNSLFGQQKRSAPADFGVKRIAPGKRVSHAIFGEGTIVSAKDLGGDVLYVIAFDSVGTKKLMATYAKLKEI
jgi:DNA helicase-2/ATP-dependent DNA helicase PcrA